MNGLDGATLATLTALRGRRVPRAFHARDARVVARALIGTTLVHVDGADLRAARIVETEAYRGPADAACHARFGLTRRTRTLFGAPGHAYVFLIYGMYECFNVTCLRTGAGHAVLVRAGEPITGIPGGMRTDGPGRLGRAMHLTRALDGVDLCEDELFVAGREGRAPKVGVSARVGVGYAGPDAEAPWRFFDSESPHVSRPAARMIGLGGSPPGARALRRPL